MRVIGTRLPRAPILSRNRFRSPHNGATPLLEFRRNPATSMRNGLCALAFNPSTTIERRTCFRVLGPMKKIISLFQRNYDGDRLVRDEVTQGAEWVIAGEGVATRKWDGTCCMIRDGKLLKRHEIKKGQSWPPNFEPANEVDEVTGKQQGWVPVGNGPEDQWHREACSFLSAGTPDGTFELIGPKVNGNPEKVDQHMLIRHGFHELPDVPVTFEELKEYLSNAQIEGIVWKHPDGRMVKIKKKDFGLKRN